MNIYFRLKKLIKYTMRNQLIKKQNSYYPYFLVVPFDVFSNKNLNQTDGLVFGAVYYFENLSKKMCTASNKEIGRIIFKSHNTVSKSLGKLEREGMIKRALYMKDESFHRGSIKTLVKVGVNKKDIASQKEVRG